MALTRFNGDVVPFASESTTNNRTVFGDVVQADDIDSNLNADFKKGWEIIGLNDNPTKQDFNAMGYTLGALTSYLYQMGIAEYNVGQEYKLNAVCIGTGGNIYQSLVDSNIGNALSATSKWKNVTGSFVALTGNQTIAGVKTFSSTIVGSVNGNSATATKLATARTINGVSFDGSQNITVADSTKAPLDGTGATGTWNISVSGNAATVTDGVYTVGNQIIDGIKTFVKSPIVPTPTTGDNSTKVATTAFVKAKSEADSIGVGQEWQNVTSSRSAGVTYTNSTGKPIAIGITINPGTTSVKLQVDGIDVNALLDATNTVSYAWNMFAIVPDGSTYTLTTLGSASIISWSELR